MTSNRFSLISSGIESDHCHSYCYLLGSPTPAILQLRVRVSFVGTIEKFQVQAFDQFIPSLLISDFISEYNTRL